MTTTDLIKYSDMKTDVQRIEFVKQKLKTDDRWLFKGLIAIYQCQTEDEQATDSTRNINGIGFSAYDAEFLSSVARQVMTTRSVSVKQLGFVRKNMIKYAGQLVRISKGEA